MSLEQFLLTWNQALWILYDLVPMGSCSARTILFLVSLEHVLVLNFYHVLKCRILYLNNLQIRLYFGFIVFAHKGLIDKHPNLDLMFLSATRKFLEIRIISYLKLIFSLY